MRRLLLAAAFACLASACATHDGTPTVSDAAARSTSTADLAKAADAVRGSTKAQVTAALGSAAVVRFDSGYEVWVYRYVQKAPARPNQLALEEIPPSELVLLFAPSGVVTKVRIRPPSSSSS
jgi:outer membrane protein assembly factor BamE (lipoprotein component of BamABCDE complex)